MLFVFPGPDRDRLARATPAIPRPALPCADPRRDAEPASSRSTNFAPCTPTNEDVTRQARDGDERVYPHRKMVSQTEHRRGPAILERAPRRHEHRRSAAAFDRAQQPVLAVDGQLPCARVCETGHHRPRPSPRLPRRSAQLAPTSKNASPATSSISRIGTSRSSAASSCAPVAQLSFRRGRRTRLAMLPTCNVL